MFRTSFLLLFLLLSGLFVGYGLVRADISGALYQSLLTLTNSSGSTLDNEQVDFPLSGRSLISSGTISSDALNSQVQSLGLDVGSMPASDRLTIEGAVFEITGAFTDYTAEAQSTTANDVPIFTDPITSSQNFYFGCFTRCRIVAIDLSSPSDGNYTLAWTYWNGSTWVAHSNVSDGTSKFTITGFSSVSWDMPTNWAETSVDGVTSFWTRAEVSSPIGSPPGPIADRIQFETGMWWVYLDSLLSGEQRQYRLYMGGPDMKTRHQIFTGPGGITAVDDPTAELSDTYLLHWSGVLNFEASGGVKCIVCKGLSSGDPFRLYISDSAAREVTVEVRGNDSIDFTVPIPEAVTEHTIDISSDGTEFVFTVGGVSVQTTAAVTVTDSVDDWFFVQNDSAVYSERMYIVADASSLALEQFNSQGEWDTGSLASTETVGGQPDFTQRYIPEASTDDGFWNTVTENFFPTSTVARFGFCGGTCSGVGSTTENAFFRFDNLEVTQGLVLTSAELRFMNSRGAAAGVNDTVNVTVSALAEDDASAPSSFADATTRVTGSQFFQWNAVPHFLSNTYDAGFDFHTIDVTSIVQEVIDRPGWNFSNSIVFYVEDNGSTTAADFTSRSASTADDKGLGTSLFISYPAIEPSLSNDFVQLDQFSGQPTPLLQSITSWSTSCAQCTAIQPRTDKYDIFGKYSLRVDARVTSGSSSTASIWQDIAASPGEVWSFRVKFAADQQFASGQVDKGMLVHFLDSGDNILQTTRVALAGLASTIQEAALNGNTAPANTVKVRIQFTSGCGLSCSSVGRGYHYDGIVGCVCNPAPNFPDAANVVLNPSFEQVYRSTGTWTSPTISPTNVNVQDSAVSWDSFSPGSSSLLVETSIDNQATWQPVGNGESITGIDTGDDLTGTTLHIRVTPTSDGSESPAVSQLFVIILDDILDDSTVLFFELRDLPTGTLTDHSPFDNTGTMEFPFPLVQAQSSKTAGPVLPVSGGAGGFPGFGNLPPGLEPTRPSLVGDITQPTGFFSGCQNSPNLPLYDVVNPTAVSLDWEACTLYEVLVLGVAMVVSIGTYLASGHPLLAIVLGGAIMYGGVQATVLSGWILIIHGIVGVLIIAIGRNI